MSIERFTVLSNYLYHFRKACLDTYSGRNIDFRKLHKGITNANVVPSINRKSNIKIENIRKTLHNSWLTEFNLHQEFYFDIDALDITYFLGWKIVQSYYVCFLTLRAIYEIYLGSSQFGHADLLNRFAKDAEEFGFRFPFNVKYGKGGHKNIPKPIKKIKPIYRHHGSHNYLALWCKTTFEERQKDRWRRASYPRKKWGKVANVDCPEVTLLDCLYRLRKKHNYDSIDHLLSEITEAKGKDFVISLSVITFSFLCMAESILWQLLSPNERNSIIKKYIKSTDINRQIFLKMRIERFLQAFD